MAKQFLNFVYLEHIRYERSPLESAARLVNQSRISDGANVLVDYIKLQLVSNDHGLSADWLEFLQQVICHVDTMLLEASLEK